MGELIITKTTGGLGRRTDSGDAISGFLANGVAVAGGVQLSTVYRCKSIDDVIALQIDADYDSDNSVLVYEHLFETFRVNPNADIYLMLLPQATSYEDMLDLTIAGNAKKLLLEADGDIKQLAVAYNPSLAVTDFTDTAAAIAKAQALAADEYTKHRPVEILLEGKGWDFDNPTDLTALNAENVSVMVGQSNSVASGDATYAAVGTLLGAVTRAAVNENIGWVREFNVLGGDLQVGAISGTKLSDISDGALATQSDNGAIHFRTHAGRAGLYFNDSFTCTLLTSDYCYIENNRTIHKAVRLIRQALLPRVNSPVLVDGDTGQLPPSVTKSIETDGRKALEAMIAEAEVSSIDIFVDPAQNILSTSELKVAFEVVPTGTARTIRATIGFKNPF